MTRRTTVAASLVVVLATACAGDGPDDAVEVGVTVPEPEDPSPDDQQPADSTDPATPDSTAPTPTGPAPAAAEPTTDDPPASDPPATDPAGTDPQGTEPPVLDTTPPREPAPPPSPRGFDDTVYERGAIDPGLAPFVSLAIDDLATRLATDPASITTLTAVLVVWPDAGLGCPEPGMSYAQVATDGSVIELGVDDLVYRYHTGGSSRLFLCERPLDRPPAAIPAP